MTRPKIVYLTSGLLIILLMVLGVIVWQKSDVKPATKTVASGDQNDFGIKKVDMSKEPEWVQKLVLTATPGRSANGLRNVNVKATGFPAGLVDSLTYVLQYETTNKGTQGALATKPVVLSGATDWERTIDLGTCSTKSCVAHEGVKSVDLELDLTTTSGDQFTWTGTLDLKQ